MRFGTRIATAADGDPLEPTGCYFADAHNEAFSSNQRSAAQLNNGYCAKCHVPKECIDCHHGVSKHINESAQQSAFAACHRRTGKYPGVFRLPSCQTYCVERHQSAKVTWEPAVSPTSAGVVASQGREQVVFQERNQRF